MAGELEKAVGRLEALFQKTDSDLNHFKQKLESEFQNAGCLDDRNPVQLAEQISNIRKEYSSLVDETRQVQQAQKEMMDYFYSQMGNLMKITSQLGSQTNQDISGNSEELKALERLVGFPILEAGSSIAEPSSSSSSTSENPVPKNSKENISLESEIAEKNSSSLDFPVSPASKRKNLTEFLPLTEEEFHQVSDLVRCRAKLEDVNKCYKILWQHFKEENNKQFLSTKDMHEMGLKITGQTGEAKLKTLRSLKLLTLNSKGSAKLL